jgi:hypothetical protein
VTTSSATGSAARGGTPRGVAGEAFCQLQAAPDGRAQRHVLRGACKVLGKDTGLATRASEHDTVSVLAADEVVLYLHEAVLGGPLRDGDNDKESR